MDKLDIRILNHLQRDAGTPIAQIADAVGLSTNACWRRIKHLEESGVIRQRTALLDERLLGLKLTVFISVKTSEHNESWLGRFAAGVQDIPEVTEFYRMSGDVDYLLKVVVKDIEDYDRVYKRLIAVAPLHDVSSSFAMERIKYSTALPLESAG